MNGGTTFHFLDASPAQALAQARQAAAGRDIRIGGGPSTIREFLAAGLIDYLHIVVVPIVLGRGERLWDGLEALDSRFQIEAATRRWRRHPRHPQQAVTGGSTSRIGGVLQASAAPRHQVRACRDGASSGRDPAVAVSVPARHLIDRAGALHW